MEKVRVHAGGGYPVLIGDGLLKDCGGLLLDALGAPCRIAVVADRNVAALYLDTVLASLERAGFSVFSYVFPAGESSKSMAMLAGLLEFLAERRLTRTDCVVALGGGVTGDLAGFAAGCYLRGVRFVQLPTTLLSAVDSSVGGKTGVNLAVGKNLAGLFHQPSAVLCDTDCIRSLPAEVFADGVAEAAKTGILKDESLFRLFETGGYQNCLPEVIARCVTIKGRIVDEDEFDNGGRRVLNLGHTIGHAIEKCSGYTMAHGHAVAVGMVMIARAAERMKFCEEPCSERIAAALLRCGLPVSTDYTAAELAEAAVTDKKRTGGDITLVLPRKIGDCRLKKIPVGDLRSVIEAGEEVVPCR